MSDLPSTLLSLIQEAAPAVPKVLPKLPDSADFWMPLDASVTVRAVDWIYDFIYWTSVVSCVVILGAMGYFVIKYRAKSRRANEVPEKSPDHSTTLEVAWSILPMFVLVAIFVWGFQGFVDLRTAPKGAMEIRATGQQWKWLFNYPGGLTDDTLHVPVDRPVRMLINATDVLHSLFIPNFRVKMDAVPGRYTELWFQATKTGEFPVFCAEYCGIEHSEMQTRVVVHPPGGYEKWLQTQKDHLLKLPPLELGKLLYEKQGCSTCHSVDGTPKIGPTWKGVFGKQEALADGSQVTVDENYVRESIVDPNAKIVQGFVPSMPTYQGKLKDAELDGIIAYIKSLK
jgi:cytochrome c oxidase subunit 2